MSNVGTSEDEIRNDILVHNLEVTLEIFRQLPKTEGFSSYSTFTCIRIRVFPEAGIEGLKGIRKCALVHFKHTVKEKCWPSYGDGDIYSHYSEQLFSGICVVGRVPALKLELRTVGCKCSSLNH